MKELLLKQKFRLGVYIFACFLPILTHISTQYIFSLMLGSIKKSVELDNFSFFLKSTILSLIIALLGSLLFLLSRFMRIGYMRDFILGVRVKAFQSILNKTYNDFTTKSKDVYTSHLVNDINLFENNFFYSLMNIIYNVGLYSICLVILGFMDIKFSITIFCFSIISFLFGITFKRKTIALKRNVSKNYEDFTLNISNTFSGLEIIKLNSAKDLFMSKSFESVKDLEKSKFNYSWFTQLQQCFSDFISNFVFLGVFIYILYAIRSGYNLTSAVFMMQLGNSCMRPIAKLPPILNEFKASCEIYKNLITNKPSTPSDISEKKDFKFNQNISIDNLSFSYGSKPIITDSSFEIIKGKKYLICGESGSGKSTLLKILSKTLNKYSGEIKFDGINSIDISNKSFNENVSFIYQDVFLFEDTLFNNISLFKDFSEDEVINSLKKSGLDEFLEDYDLGLSKPLKENGKNLSGGQRQRVSIARSIIKKSPIIFVDEGTSSLNEDLARNIEDMLLSLDSTVISISHRYYSGITDKFDYVLELKNNKISQHRSCDYFKEVLQI